MAKKIAKQKKKDIKKVKNKIIQKKKEIIEKRPVAQKQLLIPARIQCPTQKLNIDEVKSIENEIRDIMNLVAVFEHEYDLPREVVDQLLTKLHDIARRVGWLRCK